MKSNLTMRWIGVCVVWVAAIALSYWNMNAVSAIIMDMEQEEIYRMDDVFWQYNSGKISQVLPQKDIMIRPIDSLRLGFLEVESNLETLSRQHQFEDILVEMSPNDATGNGIPIRVSFKGPFGGILPWLKDLEAQFPFLPVTQVKVTVDPINGQTRYQIIVFFRYDIISRQKQAAASDTIPSSAVGAVSHEHHRRSA